MDAVKLEGEVWGSVDFVWGEVTCIAGFYSQVCERRTESRGRQACDWKHLGPFSPMVICWCMGTESRRDRVTQGTNKCSPSSAAQQAAAVQALTAASLTSRRSACLLACAGGSPARVEAARAIVEAGVAVMGHVGLTPQSISVLGGFRPQAQVREQCTALHLGFDLPRMSLIGGRVLKTVCVLKTGLCTWLLGRGLAADEQRHTKIRSRFLIPLPIQRLRTISCSGRCCCTLHAPLLKSPLSNMRLDALPENYKLLGHELILLSHSKWHLQNNPLLLSLTTQPHRWRTRLLRCWSGRCCCREQAVFPLCWSVCLRPLQRPSLVPSAFPPLALVQGRQPAVRYVVVPMKQRA